MIGPCFFDCNNKNELGYCLTTACINPNYNYSYFSSMINYNYPNSPCENCSNNPKNGGSGICHCILGVPRIT